MPQGKPAPDQNPGLTGIPTQEEISTLPRWAIVAFAARCARRVQPLFQHYWPQAPKKHIEAIDRAITLSEHAASVGNSRVSSLNDMALAAFAASVAAHAEADSVLSRAVRANSPTHVADSIFLASRVGDAAARAARAARIATDNAYAAEAAHIAAKVAVRVSDAQAVRRDFNHLRLANGRDNWAESTTVSPEFFGPIWPNGEPKEWPTVNPVKPSASAAAGASPLSLYFSRSEFSPQEIADVISELSALYASVGGDELVIDDMTVMDPAVAFEPVDGGVG